jgi:hypothetical protein
LTIIINGFNRSCLRRATLFAVAVFKHGKRFNESLRKGNAGALNSFVRSSVFYSTGEALFPNGRVPNPLGLDKFPVICSRLA